MLGLCPEQDARPGHRASTAKGAGTGTGLSQRSRAVHPRRGGRAHWRRRGGQGADTQGTPLGLGWRQEDTGGALTLPGLLLPRQRAAQLAQERLVLLHLGGPRGGRSRWRGGHM